MFLHPISRHRMSSRVTRPSPWRIFCFYSQPHHLSVITFTSTWFLRVPWSRFVYLSTCPSATFRRAAPVTQTQELDTKCFRRAKDTPRAPCNSKCSRGVWRRPCPNHTLRRFLFQVFDEQCLGPFSVFSEQWKHTGGTHCSTQPEKKYQRFMCGALVGIHTPSHLPQWSRDLLQQCYLAQHCESINELTEPEINPSR